MRHTKSDTRSSARRLISVAVAMTVATTLAAGAEPANAAKARPCAVVKHGNTAGVTTIGTATATLVSDGIKLTTARSTNADKVSWKRSFRPVPASSVKDISYRTVKLDTTAGDNSVVNDAALPAYHIYVRTPKGTGVLVYEPYYSLNAGNPPRNVRTEWNVLNGPLWTPSSTVNGLDPTAGGPATLTFAQVAAANPRMTVTGIGFGLGTY